MNSNIHQSFRVGDEGERIFEALLKNAGFDCKTNPNKNADYDLDCGSFTVEVKHDVYSRRSGNVAIEVFNTKKNVASGLYATKADLWGHIIPDEDTSTCWLTQVQLLKQFVSNNKPFKQISNAGDQNALLMLYKDTIILPSVFYRVDMINSSALHDLVRSLIKGKH